MAKLRRGVDSLPDNTFDSNDTLLGATVRAVHHRRKTMSRRTGQDGSVEPRNGMWRGRYLVDVPGRFERIKRAVILGSVKEMTKSEARRRLKEIIRQTGINEPTYEIPSVLTFEQHAEQWEESYVKRMKPSNQKQLRFVLRRYLQPRWA